MLQPNPRFSLLPQCPRIIKADEHPKGYWVYWYTRDRNKGQGKEGTYLCTLGKAKEQVHHPSLEKPKSARDGVEASTLLEGRAELVKVASTSCRHLASSTSKIAEGHADDAGVPSSAVGGEEIASYSCGFKTTWVQVAGLGIQPIFLNRGGISTPVSVLVAWGWGGQPWPW